MAGLGNIFQKAVYMGVGLASYAAEKASKTLQELRTEAQKLADEMVQRGEITAEEARKMVDEMVQKAQEKSMEQSQDSEKSESSEPRLIEIVADDEEEEKSKKEPDLDALRSEVESLQDELHRLKRN